MPEIGVTAESAAVPEAVVAPDAEAEVLAEPESVSLPEGDGAAESVAAPEVAPESVDAPEVAAAPESAEAPAAVALAEAGDTGRVTWGWARTYDGTGHGEPEACWINSSNPLFADGPVDDEALDGNVCLGDTVGYSLSYSVEPGVAETYLVTLTSGTEPVGLSTRDWCAGGGSYLHTGEVVETADSSFACKMTFPETSGAATLTTTEIRYEAPLDYPSVATGTPTMTVASEDGATTLQTLTDGDITWLSAPTIDVAFGATPVYPLSTYGNNSDGEFGLILTYQTLVGNAGTSTGYSATKGIDHSPIPLDLSVALPANLPADYEVLPGPGTEDKGSWVDNGNGTASNSFLLPSTQGVNNYGAPLRIWMDATEALPASGTERYVVNLLPGADGVTFGAPTGADRPITANYGTGLQPGSELTSGQSTAGVLGRGARQGQQGYANNDWMRITVVPLDVQNWAKNVSKDVGGKPNNDSSVAVGGPNGTHKVWSVFTASPVPLTVSDAVLCDAWPVTNPIPVDTELGAMRQVFDPSRSVNVMVWTGTGYRTLGADEYTVQFNHSTEAAGTAARCAGDAGWSTSPTGEGAAWMATNTETGESWETSYPNTVRVLIDSELNMGVTGAPRDEVVRVEVPFVSGPLDREGGTENEVFPRYPRSTYVYNELFVAYGYDTPVRAVGTGGRDSFSVQGSDIARIFGADIVTEGGVEATSLNPALTYVAKARLDVINRLYIEGEPFLSTYGATQTLSSCAIVDPEAIPTFTSRTTGTWAVTSVTEPDPGPDGIPCTADDVSGWTILWETTEPVDVRTLMTYSPPASRFHVDVPFTIVPYAPNGTQIVHTIRIDQGIGVDSVNNPEKSATVAQPQILAQDKFAQQSDARVGTQIGWTSTFLNSMLTDLGESRFIDILPFNGDAGIRQPGDQTASATDGALTGITITAGENVQPEWLWVTSAEPSTLVNDVSDATNELDGVRWVPLAEAGSLTGEITAYQLVMPTFVKDVLHTVLIQANTDTATAGDRFVNNHGVGFASGATGGELPVTGNAPIELWEPKVEITKAVDQVTDVNENGITDAGDTVTFTITVTNTGTVPLTGVTLDDPLLGGAVEDAALADGLDVDEVVTLTTAAYTVTADDEAAGTFTNEATVTGVAPDEFEVTASASAAVETEAPAPALETAKTAEITADGGTEGIADAGDVITYTITVTNTGNVPVSEVSVEDTMSNGAELTLTPETAGPLAPEGTATFTATYTVTQEDVDSGAEAITNTATATGTTPETPDVEQPVSLEDGATTPLPVQAPALHLAKDAAGVTDVNGNGVNDTGDTIAYTFTVTNNGNVTVSEIAIDDPLLAGLDLPVTCEADKLAPGEQTTCTAEGYAITADDLAAGFVTNVATAAGVGPDGESVASAADTATVLTKAPEPPVTPPAPEDPAAPETPEQPGPAAKPKLPVTGADVLSTAVMSLAALLGGGLMLAMGRRRQA